MIPGDYLDMINSCFIFMIDIGVIVDVDGGR